jgi:hypothetical protein
MNKSELKSLIKECINSVLAEDFDTKKIITRWRTWLSDTFDDRFKIYDDPNILKAEYYKYAFATLNVWVNTVKDEIDIEVYYDSERLDNMYGYRKKYKLSEEDTAIKDIVNKFKKINGDESLFGGMDDE